MTDRQLVIDAFQARVPRVGPHQPRGSPRPRWRAGLSFVPVVPIRSGRAGMVFSCPSPTWCGAAGDRRASAPRANRTRGVGGADHLRHLLRGRRAQRPERPGDRETAVQEAFTAGARIATHSTWWVKGKRSKARRVMGRSLAPRPHRLRRLRPAALARDLGRSRGGLPAHHPAGLRPLPLHPPRGVRGDPRAGREGLLNRGFAITGPFRSLRAATS